MNSTEYSAIYNYVVRGEYPAGFSKEEKRSLRVKVEARGTQKELGRKFLAKDGLLYVDKRPDGLGIRERRVVKVLEKKSVLKFFIKFLN